MVSQYTRIARPWEAVHDPAVATCRDEMGFVCQPRQKKVLPQRTPRTQSQWNRRRRLMDADKASLGNDLQPVSNPESLIPDPCPTDYRLLATYNRLDSTCLSAGLPLQ